MEKALETREKIVDIVKAKGPILPVQISKEIGTSILLASAHLAELTASKRMKISNIKVGGSPLYYLQGQESMLQKFATNLNEKEKKAFDLLSQNKILRDREQEPVIRVALREIKDFAHPLSVSYNNNSELFWKWHLVSDEEASNLIRSKIEPSTKISPSQKEIQKEEPKKELEQQKTLKPEQEKLKQTAIEKTDKKEKIRKPRIKNKEDEFLKDLIKFFEKNSIKIINTEIIRKNSEMDFVLEIPSVVGSLQYYCKARNKKRIGDSDLSAAYVKGQFRKLPVLVLSSGELSTKAQEMLAKELNSITFKKI